MQVKINGCTAYAETRVECSPYLDCVLHIHLPLVIGFNNSFGGLIAGTRHYTEAQAISCLVVAWQVNVLFWHDCESSKNIQHKFVEDIVLVRGRAGQPADQKQIVSPQDLKAGR